MPVRALSLSLELLEVEAALQAARLAADLIRFGHALSDNDAREAPRAVSATLALVTARLREVCSVLRHEAAPAIIVAPHNMVAADDGLDAEADTVLPLNEAGQVRPTPHRRRRR